MKKWLRFVNFGIHSNQQRLCMFTVVFTYSVDSAEHQNIVKR